MKARRDEVEEVNKNGGTFIREAKVSPAANRLRPVVG